MYFLGMSSTERFLTAGQVLTRAELEEQVSPQLAELNETQGSSFSFEDYLTESVLTGTIETVAGD